MPINLFWGDPHQTVLHAQFGETWTLEEYHKSIDDMYEMISSVPHRVHIVSDFSRNRSAPAGLLSAGSHIENRRAINSGINVVIGATSFLKSMLQVAQRLYLTETEIYLANSVEEAYLIIQQHQRSVSAAS
jgi:hypothetical protein